MVLWFLGRTEVRVNVAEALGGGECDVRKTRSVGGGRSWVLFRPH